MKINFRLLALLAALLLVPLGVLASTTEPNQPNNKQDCKNGGWRDFPNASFRNQGDCVDFVQTGMFVCRDPLGCVSYAEEDPIRLATVLATSGPYSNLGLDELRAVEIALDFHGLVFGHEVELRNEDSMCSPEGGQAASAAIVADSTIVAVVGTTCSSAAAVAAPVISDAGYSMVSPSNTAPVLTDPDTKAAGYLRVAPNDRHQGAAMAGFVWNDGATTSAVVVDPALYPSGQYPVALGDAFVEAFETLGGSNLAYVFAESDGSDADAVIAAVVSAGAPDVLYLPVFDPPGFALLTEARATPALDGTRLAASEALLLQEFVDNLGVDAEGMLFTATNTSFMNTQEYGDFAAAYFDKFGEQPLTIYSPFAFDATNMILSGIEAVGIIDGDGTLHIGRQALRQALFATSGLEGLTGTITCNPLGDCAAIGFAIFTVEGGEIVPVP